MAEPVSNNQQKNRKDEDGNSQASSFPWSIGICDAHCHPTDIMTSIDRIPDMQARVLTVMSTRAQDQGLVEETARRYLVREKSQLSGDDDGDGKRGGGVIVPAFGWHPWFSHLMADDRQEDMRDMGDVKEHYRRVLTPKPTSTSEDEAFLDTLQKPLSLVKFLSETEERLRRFPFALVGEVGIDRGFRLPTGSKTGDVSMKTGGSDEGTYTPGSREGRPLTLYKVNMEHQKVVLRAQLELAAKYKRAASVHSVQAHGVVFEVLQSMWKGHEKPSRRELKKKREAPDALREGDVDGTEKKGELAYPPRICMHSYSGPPDALRWFLDPKVPAEVYFSFSECVNFGGHNSNKAEGSIRAVPEDRILVESDLHCAGERMDELLVEIVRRVCDIKGWKVEDGARILRRNWERFVFGE